MEFRIISNNNVSLCNNSKCCRILPSVIHRCNNNMKTCYIYSKVLHNCLRIQRNARQVLDLQLLIMLQQQRREILVLPTHLVSNHRLPSVIAHRSVNVKHLHLHHLRLHRYAVVFLCVVEQWQNG
jgi:hypothetical protein